MAVAGGAYGYAHAVFDGRDMARPRRDERPLVGIAFHADRSAPEDLRLLGQHEASSAGIVGVGIQRDQAS